MLVENIPPVKERAMKYGLFTPPLLLFMYRRYPMYEILTQRIPIKLWISKIDDGALEQAKNIADLPFSFHHVAVMPDAHEGFGMPIGGVLAAEGAVVPNAVGVDIGCGMAAVRTDLNDFPSKYLKRALRSILREIPVGFSHHSAQVKWDGFANAPKIPVIQRELDSARYQLGTLGGGNHFIEIQKGSDGYIWIMVHSGSRNFGYTIAKEFGKTAARIAEKQKLALPSLQLSPLFLNTPEGEDYMQAMDFALKFAQRSRDEMIRKAVSAVRGVLGDFSCTDRVNIHHNYAAVESHFGKEVIVHRKGATSAVCGRRGIIPGSQGTPSYITEGLGNPDSFCSCSHGAGRIMGRKEARRSLNLQHETSRLDRNNILHSIRTVRDLDEAPGAYKDIHQVMEDQKDLVRPLVELIPLAVIKG